MVSLLLTFLIACDEEKADDSAKPAEQQEVTQDTQ